MDRSDFCVEEAMDTSRQRPMDPALDDDRSSLSSVDAEFTTFYRAEHEPQVRRAALILGSGDAAHDVVHDALASMYRRWSTIDDPGPYLNRAVLNGCRDVARRRSAERRLVDRLRRPEPTVPNDDHVFDVVGRLPFNQRAAVVLRFYAGMTEHEIANALGARPGSIGPWIHRALVTMRKEIS